MLKSNLVMNTRIASISRAMGFRLIGDVRKLLAAGYPVPAADPDDWRYARKRALAADDCELFARGITLIRAQGREANARRLNRPAARLRERDGDVR